MAVLDALGLTYTDVSQSGAGAHGVYRGVLPEGVKQVTWQLDTEPWGSNDDLPSVEIYAGKRVCVMTGAHVPGTPTEVREWDADALESLLDEHDQLPEPRDVHAEHEAFRPEEYTPMTTASDETTDDIQDVFVALDRIDARDVAGQTIVARWNDDASTSDGKRAFSPTWGPGSNGTANVVDDRIWQDTGDRGGYGGPVIMALIELGELDDRNVSPRDAWGSLWFKGIERLRELGFSIPKYETGRPVGDSEPVAVLPPAVRSWTWREAAQRAKRDESVLSIDGARERTQDAIAKALRRSNRVLIEALPTMGKSFGTIAAAADTGEPITVLTGRGRKEQYEQIREWCDEHGLSHYTLPSFARDCDTANGEHGDEWKAKARDWYARGATPKAIHAHVEGKLGRPLPCQEHEGQECPYTSAWRFDPDDYDVLIGHYNHGHKRKVAQGRTVVFDEFPGGAYETTLSGAYLAGGVTYFLQCHDALPFDDFASLIEHRHDDERCAEALEWFEGRDLEPDETAPFGDSAGHASAPLAVFTLLASDDLGNGWERADLDDGWVGLYDRVKLLTPAPLDYTRGIVALDGTPTVDMWEFALGVHLNHRSVLSDPERVEYIRDVLCHKYVRTTEAIKPYNSADHVAVEQDAALLEAIAEEHGERPSVITTSTAEHEYDAAGVLDLVDAHEHYGNVLGSNQFTTIRLGAVIGSQHYGDRYIEKWGAYAGEAVERGEEKGAALTYGKFGDRILVHMREHETLQAAMRFGRDGNGATVYVHTNTLPEWVPITDEGRVINTWSDGMKQVLEATRDRDQWTTAEVAAEVGISERQVRAHLWTLVERGDLSEPDIEGCGFVWKNDGLHRMNDHGDVDLAPIAADELTAEESAEVARSSFYTWDFRTPDVATGTNAAGPAKPDEVLANGGEPPPDDPR